MLLSIHTGLRNEELRLLQWEKVDLIDGCIQVGKSKTEEGSGRLVPLSQTALQALKAWRLTFPNAKPEHYVFPSERYRLIGRKDAAKGTVEAYDIDPAKPIGSWRRHGVQRRKRPTSNAAGMTFDTPSLAELQQVEQRTRRLMLLPVGVRRKCASGIHMRRMKRTERPLQFSTVLGFNDFVNVLACQHVFGERVNKAVLRILLFVM